MKLFTVLALLMLMVLGGCAHLQPAATTVQECAKISGQDLAPDLLPTFRQVLATPTVAAFEAGAAALVAKFGWKFVRCMFSVLGAEAGQILQSGGTPSVEPQIMQLNARNWLATHEDAQ